MPDSGYRWDARSASKASRMRKLPVRLSLTTADIAKIFGVKSSTIRQWCTSKKLVLTGNPITDFIELSRLYAEYKRKNDSRTS